MLAIFLLALFLPFSARAAPPATPSPPDAGPMGARFPDVDVVATAVRDRGFPCSRPSSIGHDAAASRPDRDAWVITCSEGRYRVIYEGDTGAQVTPER